MKINEKAQSEIAIKTMSKVKSRLFDFVKT